MAATQVKKIEFEDPVVLHDGEQLVTVFMNKPDGLICKCFLVQTDGTKIPIGENVEDIVEDGHESETTGGAPQEGSGSEGQKEEG